MVGAAGTGTRKSMGNVTRVSVGSGSSAGNVTLVQADSPHATAATIHAAGNGGRPRFRLVATVSRFVSGRWACIMLSDSVVFLEACDHACTAILSQACTGARADPGCDGHIGRKITVANA